MIWCVEDDDSIRDIEVYALRSTGFEAEGFQDGSSFWEALQSVTPDLVVLDLMLPGIDGIELLRRMKTSAALKSIPVVLATAKGDEYDKILGLDSGADYYLAKPFGVMELVSCVKAVLRRCAPSEKPETIISGDIVMDMAKHSVTVGGKTVNLTFKEFNLLKFFISNPDIAFTRDKLLTDIWGMNYWGETRTVDMHVQTLRKKLGSAAENIVTVRNVGYKWKSK